jgi:hypothetical protein
VVVISTWRAIREPPRALEDALTQIAEGEGQRVIDMIDKEPPGAPIETRWGLGFRPQGGPPPRRRPLRRCRAD